MLVDYALGQGSIVLRVKILNSSVSTGAGLTGLTSASTGLIISTIADNESSATTYTVAGSTIETITTLGTYAAPTATKCRFKEVDSTNHKGIYEIQIADARFAVASSKSVLISISGATNAAECDAVIPLRSVNPYDSVRFGMTSLPNATAGANTGLPVVGTQVPNATAGAANGLFICGTNAPVTITGSGNALTITSTGGNGSGLVITGNGTGHGADIESGSGATGDGFHVVSNATNGNGFLGVGTGTGDGMHFNAGVSGRAIHANGPVFFDAASGNNIAFQINGSGSGAGVSVLGGNTGTGMIVNGGGTSGAAIQILTTSGDGLSITPTAGNAIVATANGTSKHGAVITGGTAGTSDGIKAVAGTGGVDVRGNITGNVTGTLSGSVGSISGITFPTNFSTLGISAAGKINEVVLVDTLTTYTGNTPQTGDCFPFSNRTVIRGTVSATSPSTTGFTASALSPSGTAANQFIGRIIVFDNSTTTAALQGQATVISANTGAALPVFTLSPALTNAPTSGDTFSIL